VKSSFPLLHLRAAGLVAVAVTLGVAAAQPAAARPVSRAAPSAAQATAVRRAAAPGASRSVVLINGGQVTVPAAGRGPDVGRIGPAAGGGSAAPMMSLTLGGHQYAIPAAALPYLGHGLDPSLFDVAALASRETGGRLPVQVGYQGRRPVLPGVTITSAGGGIARGYLTASSAKAFGALLTRQYLADRPRASYGTDGLFAGGVSIDLAGTTQPPAARPDFPMHTLTVTGTNLAGQPDTGDQVLVINVDNNALNIPSQALNVFYHGSAKFSEPVGHYFALASFTDVSGGNVTGFRADILPQFTVSGNTTVQTAERAATSEVMAVTPRPAVSVMPVFTLVRPAATGVSAASPPVVWEAMGAADVPLWVSPTTRRPTAGTLQTVTDFTLASPAGAAGTPYEYDLVYSSSGVIPPQRHVVRAAGLSTVDQSDYLDTTASGYQYRNAWLPPQLYAIQWSYPVLLTLPGRRVDYTTASPQLAWSTFLVQNPGKNTGGTLQSEAEHVYRPGERVSENLNVYPLHEGADVDTIGAAYWNTQPVSASRSGNQVTLDFVPFTDNNPGDNGTGFGTGFGAPVTGTYEIDDNGVKVASGDATQSPAWQATVSAKPSVIRFILNAAQPAALSDRTQTVWTWNSAATAAQKLPRWWLCPSYYFNGPLSDCTVQPLMTLDYNVAGMSLSGSVPAGRQVLGVTVGHLQLSQAAKVTGATVQVSFDGGQTWQPAAVTGNGGRYQATFTAPATGTAGYVTLRVTAADAAGGQISETIWRAYEIAS